MSEEKPIEPKGQLGDARETANRQIGREGPAMNKRITGAMKYETHEQEKARKPHTQEVDTQARQEE